MTGNPELIQEMIGTMNHNRTTIEEEIATLVFYMEGGLGFNEAYALTAMQRERISKVIEKHYEARSAKQTL